MIRTIRALSVLVGLIANLIPLYGVLYWGWDTFQLLMLYWMATVIIAFWTILGIARLPADQLGTIKVGGRIKPATYKLLCGYFTLVAGMFILGHLLFLWLIFSGEWLKKLPASSSILKELFVADGVWLALIFMFVSAWISYLSRTPVYPRAPARDRSLQQPSSGWAEDAGSDAVGEVVGGLLIRIFIMQAAIIFGGMLAKTYGSVAPLLIVISLKTLIDMAQQAGGRRHSSA